MTPEGIARLKADEGLRLMPYQDETGNTTIGYGRNLSAGGISTGEASVMLDNDLARITDELLKFPWFGQLDPVRQDAIENMAYNLGVHGLLTFQRMIAALELGAWETAADECLVSRAARLLPNRYRRIAAAIRTGSWA